MKNAILFSLVITFLFIGCEMKKYGNDTDSFSEISDVTEDTDIIDNDVETDANGTENTNDIDDETPDEDYSDIPCGSIYFNGIDSYISVEHGDALNLGTTWTIEAWVMQDDINAQNPIIRKGDETGTPSYWIYGKSSDMMDEYISTPNGGFQYGTTDTESLWLQSKIAMSSMNWFHVALSKSESEIMIFVNGTLQETIDSVKTMHEIDENLYFGAKLNGTPVYFAGLIDEIRLSSTARYAENFTPEKRLEADNTTIAVWHFDEDSGAETRSEGKNILKGILNGSAEFVKNCNFKKSECDNECFIEGETRCSNGVLKTCSKNNSGCLEYINEVCSSGVCANDFKCAKDSCLFAGMSICINGEIKICIENIEGILEWVSSARCFQSECADNSSCLSCIDECDYLGEAKCYDGKIHVCQRNANCLKWSEEKECALSECSDSKTCKSNGWKDIATGYSRCEISNDGELFCSLNELTPKKMSPRKDWSAVDIFSVKDNLVYLHICGIAGGELYCYGDNSHGQLGDGTNVSKNSFTRVGERSDWTKISTQETTTCGIAGGELFCWGNDNILTPQKVGKENNWTEIDNTCGIASEKIYCWTSFPPEPEQVDLENNWTMISSGVSSGQYVTCAISNGELFCWYKSELNEVEGETNEDKLALFKIGEKNNWSYVITGYYRTCGISGGELYCWGSNALGLLGNGRIEQNVPPTIEKISPYNNWQRLAISEKNTCGVRGNNIYCWGVISNYEDPNIVKYFSKITRPTGWDEIGNGYNEICGLIGGKIFCTYRTYYGYTDFFQTTDYEDWDSLSLGGDHKCAIRNEKLYCWGDNDDGAVGDSSYINKADPTIIDSDKNWQIVDAGLENTCGISDGRLYCWGRNGSGQLGNGTQFESNLPQRVGEKSNWETVSVGYDHVCGIIEGELFCWGGNMYGQSNSESVEFSMTPNKFGEKTDWEKVISGTRSTCALANGELYCWGKIAENFINSNQTLSTPVRLGSYNDYRQISINAFAVCGLRQDDSLVCWSKYSFVSDQQNDVFYPEKIMNIGWSNIQESPNDGSNMCSITSNKELYCSSFQISTYLSPIITINP